MRRVLRVCLLAVVALNGAADRPSVAADPAFGAHWNDGKAELSGYRLSVERYGRTRQGRAVAIYVTEPFSRSKHVKLDDPAKSPGDAIEVLKLNLVRDFQTGIYDYKTMVSLFVSAADFTALKTAFTSSEWCGQVYEELDVRGTRLTQRVSSYFEGESVQGTLAIPKGGLQEDDLFILLRGLRRPFLKPGEKRSVPLLASPFYRRLTHRPPVWANATIERLARPETVVVPAGSFAADVFVVRPSDGREGRFHVERSYPHRIVKWAWKAGASAKKAEGTDAAELTGTTRLEYWRTHDPGDEKYLERLGLGRAVK